MPTFLWTINKHGQYSECKIMVKSLIHLLGKHHCFVYGTNRNTFHTMKINNFKNNMIQIWIISTINFVSHRGIYSSTVLPRWKFLLSSVTCLYKQSWSLSNRPQISLLILLHALSSLCSHPNSGHHCVKVCLTSWLQMT